MEAGCKEKVWEIKDGVPYQFHWNSTGKLLATGVCIGNDYQKDFPPDDDSTRIYTKIDTHEVRDVDAKKKTLSIDFTLTMRWLDSRIKTKLNRKDNERGEIVLGPRTIDQIWYPDLEIANRQFFKAKEEWASLITTRILSATDINQLDGMNSTEYELSIPTVEMKYGVKTTVYCKEWIYIKYPMDNQTCDVAFGSLSGSSVFTLYNTPDTETSLDTYTAVNFNITISYFERDRNQKGNKIGMTVVMRRLTRSYFLKYYVPCAMIVLVSEIGFIVPASAIPGRVALLVTQFLTLVNLFIHQMVRNFHGDYSCVLPYIDLLNTIFK